VSAFKFGKNDAVFVLCDYNWEPGRIVIIGPKNLQIAVTPGGTDIPPHMRPASPEKCALPNELICVVWETWRGANGHGSYRVERDLYPEFRIQARTVARQGLGIGRVTESAHAVLDHNFVTKVNAGVYSWFAKCNDLH
jgi:hypothetical protein